MIELAISLDSTAPSSFLLAVILLLFSSLTMIYYLTSLFKKQKRMLRFAQEKPKEKVGRAISVILLLYAKSLWNSQQTIKLLRLSVKVYF